MVKVGTMINTDAVKQQNKQYDQYQAYKKRASMLGVDIVNFMDWLAITKENTQLRELN